MSNRDPYSDFDFGLSHSLISFQTHCASLGSGSPDSIAQKLILVWNPHTRALFELPPVFM